MKQLFAGAVGVGLLVGSLSTAVRATPINVDVILADAPAGLSASVDMTVSGSYLTITLRNTSTGGASGANGLLTGLAFCLPSAYTIVSGTAIVPSTETLVNVTGTVTGGNISGEWGYQNSNTPGHFNGLAVNRVVSAMEADTTSKFSSTSIQNPSNLNGPEFGLVRDGGNAGGLAAVMNEVIIRVRLGTSVGYDPTTQANFLAAINRGTVAVTFGSPSGVPDGGSTVALLGMALSGLGLVARRLKYRA